MKSRVKMDGWKKAVAALQKIGESSISGEITATFWNQSLSKVLTNLIWYIALIYDTQSFGV